MVMEPLKPIIEQFNLAPSKKLGQNFLLDYNLINKIVRCANSLDNTTILEIGPGPGGLTRALIYNGAKHIIAVEKDERCIKALQDLQQNSTCNLEIINTDALSIDETQILPKNGKIVANLPYNVATQLLIKWLNNISHFSQLTLMFQKEVAERITAKKSSKAYGRLSIISQWLCYTEKMFDIPPEAFFPPPKVTSSVVNLIPRETPLFPAEQSALEEVCKAAFGKRRKMLRSSLKDITSQPEKLLKEAAIDPQKRPEELSIEEFCILANIYSDMKKH